MLESILLFRWPSLLLSICFYIPLAFHIKTPCLIGAELWLWDMYSMVASSTDFYISGCLIAIIYEIGLSSIGSRAASLSLFFWLVLSYEVDSLSLSV